METPPPCGSGCNPDKFNVSVNGDMVFSESFANYSVYTGSYPNENTPLGVILAERKSLGFNYYGDSAYDMSQEPAFHSIPHNASTLTIEWFASGVGWQGGYDESWAIDNVEVSIDTIVPPKASAIPTSPSSIQLVWNKDTSAKALRIQRKTGTCEATTAWSTRMDLGRNKTTVEDTGLKANTAYAYRLVYYYGGKTFSEYSACVSATTNLARTPNMPKSLVARSESDTQVTLTWTDLSTNERGFDVFRKDDQNDWAKLASTRANTPT